jgi:hypothetical protein
MRRITAQKAPCRTLPRPLALPRAGTPYLFSGEGGSQAFAPLLLLLVINLNALCNGCALKGMCKEKEK